MDDLLYDPTEDFLDDTAALLGELESQIEGHLEPVPSVLPDFGLVNPYAAPELRPRLRTSPYDYLMDDVGLTLDVLEASFTLQEAEGAVVPQPHGHGDVGLYEPETPIYGSFEGRPPLLPETDLQEHPELPSVPCYRPRRIGRRTGARASHGGHGDGGRSKGKGRGEGQEGMQYWCVKRGDLISGLTEECEGCQEDCDYAGGGFEEGAGLED